MAIAIRNVGSSVIASSVSPADKRGTGGNVDDLSVFQIFNLLSEPGNAEGNEIVERIYNAPPDAELLKLNPQALDLLNGVSSPTADEQEQLSLSLYLPAVRNPDAAPEAALTPLQIENISAIAAQFANAPFNLATLTQMQRELSVAGINTSKLSLKTVLQIAYNSIA